MQSYSKVVKEINLTKTLEIGPLEGFRTILEMKKKLFTAGMDYWFYSELFNEPGKSTSKTEISIYELSQDATITNMLDSISHDSQSLALTQDQIIEILQKHSRYLAGETGTWNSTTFFLCNIGEHIFVIDVHNFFEKGLSINVHPLKSKYTNENICYINECRCRLIVAK